MNINSESLILEKKQNTWVLKSVQLKYVNMHDQVVDIFVCNLSKDFIKMRSLVVAKSSLRGVKQSRLCVKYVRYFFIYFGSYKMKIPHFLLFYNHVKI